MSNTLCNEQLTTLFYFFLEFNIENMKFHTISSLLN